MEKMPMDELVTNTVKDSAAKVYDEGFSGVAGGELDFDSGVLTLTFTPFTAEEMGDDPDPQCYTETTARFVEIEHLLDALCKGIVLGSDLAPSSQARDYWRLVLAEKLDAVRL